MIPGIAVTYYERLDQGLRQLIAGSRKSALKHVSRNDLAALTREAAEVSGIPYVAEVDQDEVEKLLASCVPSRIYICPFPRGANTMNRELQRRRLGGRTALSALIDSDASCHD
jgi:hypothetical protein